jgi:hypothetical protein
MAAAGVPLRTLQEWMGHGDFKTTLIYADYAPAAHENEMAERAFARGTNPGTNFERKCGDLSNGKSQQTGPNGSQLDPLAKVEGRVALTGRGGSTPLSRMTRTGRRPGSLRSQAA